MISGRDGSLCTAVLSAERLSIPDRCGAEPQMQAGKGNSGRRVHAGFINAAARWPLCVAGSSDCCRSRVLEKRSDGRLKPRQLGSMQRAAVARCCPPTLLPLLVSHSVSAISGSKERNSVTSSAAEQSSAEPAQELRRAQLDAQLCLRLLRSLTGLLLVLITR